jgi:hypothetical protein
VGAYPDSWGSFHLNPCGYTSTRRTPSMRIAITPFLHCSIAHHMPSSPVSWSCVACGVKLRTRCRIHVPCYEMTTSTCVTAGRRGQYHSHKYHSHRCGFCSPDKDVNIHEVNEARKENRMQVVEEEEKGHLFTDSAPHFFCSRTTT